MVFKFRLSKNTFIVASILLTIGLIYPNFSNASPRIATLNPEELFGAVKIGEDYTKLPMPLTPLDRAPPNPPNVIGCTTPSKGFYNPKAKCEYKAKDGINYYLDEGAKIYRIAIYKDEKGNWPKPLPFGLNENSAQSETIKKITKNGFAIILGSTIRYQTDFSDLCFYSKKSKNSVICIFYNEKNEIDHLQIFRAISFENELNSDSDFKIGALFSEIPSPIIAINGSPEMQFPLSCENKEFSNTDTLVNSYLPPPRCEYLGADGLHYFIDSRSRIYRIDMEIGPNNKWPKPFPIGVKSNDSEKEVQRKILKANHSQLKNAPNCYELKNGKGETACFGFDKNGKISAFTISIWRFPKDLKE